MFSYRCCRPGAGIGAEREQDERRRTRARVARTESVEVISKSGGYNGPPFAPSHYRLTRVVHDLRKGARHRLLHQDRQIVNNSAVTKTLNVDKSASLISLQPG